MGHLLPAAVKLAEIMHRKQYGDKLTCIPLSVDTAERCRENNHEDLKTQTLEWIIQSASLLDVWMKV